LSENRFLNFLQRNVHPKTEKGKKDKQKRDERRGREESWVKDSSGGPSFRKK